MRGASEVGRLGLALLPRLLARDLVVHVGWDERHRLSGLARREHLVPGDVASADGHEGRADGNDRRRGRRETIGLRYLPSPGAVWNIEHVVNAARKGNLLVARERGD